MLPDLAFEAAFLRAALLLGVVHERDVGPWAEEQLLVQADAHGLLSDVLMAPAELSAVREALWPLAEAADGDAVCAALLTFLADDPGSRMLSVHDAVRVFSLMRTEFRIQPEGTGSAKQFEDRLMLAEGGVNGHEAPSREELDAWLDSVRFEGIRRMSFTSSDESTAFIQALARVIARARRAGADDPVAASKVWLMPWDVAEPVTIALNTAAWRVAGEVFAPLPMASRIPYRALPDEASLAIDGQLPAVYPPRAESMFRRA